MKSGTKLLVVDDEQVVCESCLRIFTRQGYKVDTSTDSHRGLRMASENDYDAILLDFKMPMMDGIEFLEALRKSQSTVPVIMITGYSTVPSAAAAMRMGAADYIPKPFTPEEISSAVHRVVTMPGNVKTADANTSISSTTSIVDSPAAQPRAAERPLDRQELLSMINAAVLESSHVLPEKPEPTFLPDALHRIRFVNESGHTVSLLAPGKGLPAKSGAGFHLRSLLIEKGYPVEVDYGTREFTFEELVQELASVDCLFFLQSPDETQVAEFIPVSHDLITQYAFSRKAA